jgi:predicted phosphodiesterase
MRLAIVSDIHGNLTALDAVIADLEGRGVDAVVHGGDLALAGCRGAEVIDRIRELGWAGIVGNTDELLWKPDDQDVQLRQAPRLGDLLRLLFVEYAPATREALGDERVTWLRGLPHAYSVGETDLVHASPGDLWRAPLPDCDASELATTYDLLDGAIRVYGHIHRPFVRKLDRFTVANCGSVGSPFDGDPRASYLLVDAGVAKVIRVEYDIEREVRALEHSSYPDSRRIAEMRRSGKFIRVAPRA